MARFLSGLQVLGGKQTILLSLKESPGMEQYLRKQYILECQTFWALELS